MSIEVRNITRRYGGFTALDGINLKVETGELVALLGPSGSGKTTLLRIIAGLDQADGGQVWFHGSDATALPIGQRKVGFVFQHYALFRHMTVAKNISFGLRMRPRSARPPKEVIAKTVKDLLQLVQLENVEGRYPGQLSGGQRQRVALARALAIEPRVLLLDEPFGALDARVRKDLRKWVRQLHDQLHITTVFVTHDQDEAMEIADRVVIMDKARIEQVGTPEEIYDQPATSFVYGFLGDANAVQGDTLRRLVEPPPMDGETAFVRPQDIDILRQPDGPHTLEAVVEHTTIAGVLVRVDVSLAGTDDRLEVSLLRSRYAELGLTPGETVWLRFNKVRAFASAKVI